ncbi:hypothetical protein GQ53DRAFT_121109 [Thozetella sp. PMI_491]|nr:hypothetical protein GQ53DRAFT_121109 [Thozetella sp. PMI_491]
MYRGLRSSRRGLSPISRHAHASPYYRRSGWRQWNHPSICKRAGVLLRAVMSLLASTPALRRRGEPCYFAMTNPKRQARPVKHQNTSKPAHRRLFPGSSPWTHHRIGTRQMFGWSGGFKIRFSE